MALLLRVSLLLTFLAATATARPGPCHTLIFFSTSLPRNPNPNFLPPQTLTLPTRRSVTFFFARPLNSYTKPQIIVDRATVDEDENNHPLPFGSYSSSFRDRTKDILSVVGSLLLGIGCGGLTAATMYLIWSLFSPNRFDFRGYGEVESDDDVDDVGPKKMGYVAIPAAVKDVGVVAAPAKKGVV